MRWPGSRSANVPVSAAAAIPAASEDGGLRRAITPGLLLFFIVGDILGGGIYALIGEVAGETGGAIWAGFALALVMAAFTAGSYAELVSKYPRAGGAGLYTHRAFGRPFVSFLVAFAVVVSGITSASARLRRRLSERVRRHPRGAHRDRADRARGRGQPARHRRVREDQRGLHARRGRASC